MAEKETREGRLMAARSSRFYRQGNNWYCSTGLPSDIVVEVEGVLFHLHKFPLLSKCGKIAQIIEESQNTKDDRYYIRECPGGHDAFYLAAKFCYGIMVELTPKNIIMLYLTAEYLEMTEEYDEDNLLAKAEGFIHKVILRNWKDCILALQSSEHLLQKAETLQIVRKCLSALSMMACTDLSLFGWPMMMYGSLQSPGGSILWNGINTGARMRSSQSDWWFEDISCMHVPMFKRLIETMMERGIRQETIAGALMYYLRKYLPGLDRWKSRQGGGSRLLASGTMVPDAVGQRALLESLEMLLPEKKGKSYCRFLLGLLRIAMILNVSQSCKDSLKRKIGMQLELATLDGLLIPSFSDSGTLYDTDCAEQIIRHFLSSQGPSIAAFSPSLSDTAPSPSSVPLNKVTKLIDSYLAEIAPDVNLKPEKMHSLLEALPESLRPLDDGIYRAFDIYFKAHPWLSETETERLCNIINCGRLSIDACAHASQNERLPLRFVLQVLFFEQLHLRSAISHCLEVFDSGNDVTATTNDVTGEIPQRDGWVSLVQQNRYLRVDMERIRSRVRELEHEFVSIKQDMGKVSKSRSSFTSSHIISRTLGCAHITPGPDEPTSSIIETAGPSPKKSIDRSRKPHSSKHV